MFVRLLSEADAAAHRELRIMSINESPQLSSPQIVRELAIYQRIGAGALMAHASGDTRVWGAFDGGRRLAGVVAVTQEAGVNPAVRGLHLWGLYVIPEDRGGPASHALISAALTWCLQQPHEQAVNLHVHRSNVRAQHWFRRFGFERIEDETLRKTQLVAMRLQPSVLADWEAAARRCLDDAATREASKCRRAAEHSM